MSTLFSGYYLRNRSTLDIGVLGYIGIVQHKEPSPEVWSVPPVTPCIHRLSKLVNYNFPTYTPLRKMKRPTTMKLKQTSMAYTTISKGISLMKNHETASVWGEKSVQQNTLAYEMRNVPYVLAWIGKTWSEYRHLVRNLRCSVQLEAKGKGEWTTFTWMIRN